MTDVHHHLSRSGAQLANRIRGRLYHGKPLNAWVPTMDW
jgi:hypothetical protein